MHGLFTNKSTFLIIYGRSKKFNFSILDWSLGLNLKNCSFICILISPIFTFSYLYEQKVLFVKFSKWRFGWIYTFWGPLNPKITFLANGLCVCVCESVCLCVCYQHNLKTNYSRNIKFGILYLYLIQMLLETFHKDRTKTLCTGAHKRILIHYGLWTKFRVSEFSYI